MLAGRDHNRVRAGNKWKHQGLILAQVLKQFACVLKTKVNNARSLQCSIEITPPDSHRVGFTSFGTAVVSSQPGSFDSSPRCRAEDVCASTALIACRFSSIGVPVSITPMMRSSGDQHLSEFTARLSHSLPCLFTSDPTQSPRFTDMSLHSTWRHTQISEQCKAPRYGKANAQIKPRFTLPES
jgi:hypothetical protein